MFNPKARFFLLYLCVMLSMAAIIGKLISLQIVNGDRYKNISGSKYNVTLSQKAPRGEITDRYGETLVSNDATYALALFKSNIGDDEFNSMLLKLIKILEENKVKYVDDFPIDSKNNKFTFENDEEKAKWFSENKYKKKLSENMDEDSLLSFYENEAYHLSNEFSDTEKRKIVGVRYSAESAGFNAITPYIIAENVPMELVAKIKEMSLEMPSIAITNNYIRKYLNNGYAAHLLGRVGKMNEKEYLKFKQLGYAMNDYVGKQGVEKLCEQYLHGTDGVQSPSKDDSGNNVDLVDMRSAQAGNNVVLTIDMKLQRIAEDSLKRNIEKISSEGGVKTGMDANAGACVVIDIKTGDVLALASYPTFNNQTFNDDYSKLLNDKNKPMWNRAVSGIYSPGSTFKPLVAISALESGKITIDEKINDEGIYKFYSDYQPRCWIWTEQHRTHGSINVTKAIEQSCNYFFYEAGRRTGIQKIDEYAAKFGLGEYTGIGLSEEVKGFASSPESKKLNVKTVTDHGWYGADTLQTAIGQSFNLYTPIQIANYIATIANGGTRYKLNLIKSVRSSDDGSLVLEKKPEIEQSVQLDPNNLAAVKQGMLDVVEEGSARAIFQGYSVPIGGKTGTAQLGTKSSNNALFAAFAPFDNPEISVCVVLEHGVRGANAGYVARDIFDEYFKLNQ